MKKRMALNSRIAEWIKNKAQTEYADDIALVVIYGSYVNGTANHLSDIDCYYIPKTERAYQFSSCFIIDGVGYDVFPIPWERVENIANLNDNLLPLVGDAQILYCSSDEDLQRFRAYQEKQKSNLANDEYVRGIAESRCAFAGSLCAQMMAGGSACDIRKMAGYAAMFLADAVALYNHDYYHYGLKKQYEDLCNRFPSVPLEIIAGYRAVVTADNDTIIDITLKLYRDVCGYIGISADIPDYTPQEEGERYNPDAAALAELYQEIISTFNKIYVCCESGNYVLAFLSAVCLQHDLDDATGLTFDLLSDFSYTQLDSLAEKTHRIEAELVGHILAGGAKIKKFDYFEEFASKE